MAWIALCLIKYKFIFWVLQIIFCAQMYLTVVSPKSFFWEINGNTNSSTQSCSPLYFVALRARSDQV
jgi:hypothetical protein